MSNELLDQLLANASKPSVGQQKQQSVMDAATAKKQQLGGMPSFTQDQMYSAVAGSTTGAGDASATQAELDARYLTPMQMWDKYGYSDATNKVLGQRAQATQQFNADQSIQRDWNQTAADTVSGVGLGAFNGLAGIGALATGIVNKDAGNALSQGIQSINEAVMDNQSPALQGRRRINQAMNVNDQRDSTQQYEQDLAAGESGFMAGAARIGRDALSSIGNAAADPATLLDGTAQAYGSLVGVGPISRVAAAANSKMLTAGRAAGIFTKDQARLLATAADKGGVAALIGSMEAGGAFQQTANDVLGMEFADLAMKSPEFTKLMEQGLSPEEARATLANKAGLEAAMVTAPAAIAMGKLVARFEAAPMSTAGLKNSLANIGTQMLEEGVQGGVSQMAGNSAIQRNADQTKTLSEGVGEQVGTGALFGGLMSAGTQGPGLALQGVEKAADTLVNALPKSAPKAPAATAPTAPIAPNSAVTHTTDLVDNAAQATAMSGAADQVMPAAAESIMQNPALDEETKAAQVSTLESLQTTFTYDPSEADAVSIPETVRALVQGSNNLPDVVAKVSSNVLEQANNMKTEDDVRAFISSVAYMDDLMGRAEGLAGREDVDAIMQSMAPDSAEAAYLSGIFQAFSNVEGSQQIAQARTVIAQQLGKSAPMASVSLDSVPEVMVRAKYAPQTLSAQALDDTLALAASGQIEISPMQRIRLQGAQALVKAMAAGDSSAAVDAVTRQVAFNEQRKDGEKYPSLVEHTNSITQSVISGNRQAATEQMVQLRNFATTMANKNAAIAEYLKSPAQGRRKYQNWIPSENKWRLSAAGLDANMTSRNSQNFAKRVFNEAVTAAATYNNLLEQFPALAREGAKPVKLPEIAPQLRAALERTAAAQQPTAAAPTPTPAPAPAPAKPAPKKEAAKAEPAPTPEPKKAETKAAPAEAAPKVEAKVEPVVVEKPAAEPEAKVEPTQEAPAVEATETVAETVTEEAPAETAQSNALARLLPGLNGKANELVQHFKFKAKSKIQQMVDPYFDIQETLKSDKAVAEATGAKIPSDLRKATAKYVSDFMGPLLGTVNGMFDKNLSAPQHGFTGTRGDFIAQAAEDASGIRKPVQLQAENKGSFTALLHKTEDGTLAVEPHLLQAASMAAGQWFLTSGGTGAHKMAEAQVASYVGIPTALVTPQLQTLVSMGLSDLDAIRGMGDKIQAYWGATIADDAPLARAQSIPLGLAANFFYAMVHGTDTTAKKFADKFFTVKEIVVDTNTGIVLAAYDLNGPNAAKKIPTFPEGSIKKIRRYLPVALPTELQGISPVLSRLTDVAVEDVTYFDPADLDVSETQLRSNVRLSKEEKAAQEAQQKVPHRINAPFLKLLRKFKAKDMVAMLGKQSFEGMNVKARESADGKNMSVLGGFNQAMATVARIEAEAAIRGADPLDLGVHYKYETTSTGRSMMQGKYNPQSDKTVRNLVMPQEARLDLTKPDQRLVWDNASIQMIGERTYAMTDAQITDRAAEIFSHPDVVALRDVLVDVLSDKDVDSSTMVQAFKTAAAARNDNGPVVADGMSNEFMHVMLDRARLHMDETGGKDFTSKLYLEADGVANGPAGAMAMLAAGQRDGMAEYVRKMRKAGLFIGLNGQYMGTHRQVDGVDAYAETGKNTAEAVIQTISSRYANGRNPKMLGHHLAFNSFISRLYPGGAISMEPDADGNLSVSIKRGATKNPMTVTVYGSGTAGIAGKISGILADELATVITEAQLSGDFSRVAELRQLLIPMVHTKPYGKKGGPGIPPSLQLKSFPVDGKFMHKDGLGEFQLTGQQFDNLRANVLEFFVKDMSQGIEKTVGRSVMEASQAMVAATSLQAIVLQHSFKKAVDALKARKLAENPEWREDLDGFSKNDLKALDKELAFLRPLLRSTNQMWDVSGSQRSVGDSDVASDMFGRYSAPMTIYAPGDAGVKVAPYLVIGMGDAHMVQNLFNDWQGQGILQVFDGINLGLNDVRSGGAQVNKAMVDAWLNSNPLQVVADSFKATVELGNIDEALAALSEDQAKKVYNSLYEQWGGPENLLEHLQNHAKEVQMQHEAIREIGFSADQMAATGVPYVEVGTSTVPNYTDAESAAQSAQEIARLLEEAIDKRRGKKVPTQTMEDLVADAPKDSHGNTVISFRGIKGLLRHVKMDDQMRSLAQEALATNAEALKDMKVVVGTTETLLAGGYDFGNEWTRAGLLGKNIRGLWDEATKTLVLAPDHDGSTLAHELIHAATLSVLFNAYMNELPMKNGELTKWGNAVRESALEVERMLLQFVAGLAKEYDHLSPKAYQQVAGLVREIRRAAQIPDHVSVVDGWHQASPQGRVAAMNEFMAHVLTNSKLREITRLQKFKSAVQAVLNFMKRVVFGERAGSQPKVGSDIYSQLEFHTRLMMNAREQLAKQGIREMMANPMVLESRVLGDEKAVRVAEAFQSMVGDYLAERPDVFTKVARASEYVDAGQMAADMTNAAESVGFLGSPAQRTAFVRMAAALATQAKVEPLVMQEAQKLYKHVAKELNTGLGLTQDQVDLLLGRHGIAEDAHARSSLVPMFFALGLVDPTFGEALAKIKAPDATQSYSGTLDEKLQAVGNNLLTKIQESVVGTGGAANVAVALDALADTVIDHARKEENLLSQVDKTATGLVAKGNDWLVRAMSQASQKVGAKARDARTGSNSKVVKAGAAAVELTSNLFNEAGAQANAEAMLAMANSKAMPEAIRSLVKDLTGRVSSNANVYDLIKRASHLVSKARQFYKEQLPSVLKAAFKTAPTDDQWTAMFKGMAKVDLASLVQSGNLDTAFDHVTDAKARKAEIARLETALKTADPRTFGRVMKKAHQLAGYMTTGIAGPGLLRNAAAVANLLGDRVSGLGAPGVTAKPDSYVDMVDQLISLYALDVQPRDVTDSLSALIKSEPEAMKQLLGVMREQRSKDMARQTGNAKFNAVKGYIPSDGTAGASLVVRDVRDEANLRQQGYTKVADYTGTTLFQQSKMAYYFTPVGKAPFNQGIIQNARMTAGGVDVSTGFAVGFPTAGRITQTTTVERLAKNMHLDTAREALLPVWDENGKIVAFERSIDPAQLERLQPSTHIAAMLGQWMGRQAEEELAQGVNFDAVAKVHEMFKQAGHRAGEFVNVLDKNAFKNDPVMRDALRLIPADVKAHAESLFGPGKFLVRRDMLADVFGYRDASIGDFWTGNSRWSPETQARVRRLAETVFGPEAFRILAQNEGRWKNLIKDAKTLIVVKSVVVPAVNFVANIFQMMARGIPLSVITKGLRNKTVEVDSYVKSNVELMDLRVKLMAAGNNTAQRQKLEAQIQAIEDSWKRLSIWPLIEAGEFGSISDAGISRDEILLSEGKLQAYIEAKTEQLPRGIRSLGKNLLLTKDTALFQGLQKSMEYGDFLAKAIVYDHRVAKGDKPADALGVITDEFVNYDRLPGRFRGSLENLGLLWFYNYKLRIAKTAFSMMRNDPLRVALLAGAGLPGVELPVTENVFTKAMEGTLGYSMGPGMLFSAPELNPWVAAMQ